MNGDAPPAFKLEGKAVDDGRPIRVLIIGAGVCGIALYIRTLQNIPNATVTIVEKNSALGGTWYENRYPGVACDIPSHVYQYSFEPNTNWSKLFSPGAEILEYVTSVAHKYRVDEKIKYNTKVIGAEWHEEKSLWVVKTEGTTVNEAVVSTTEAEVVISAVGILNNWKWPAVEGLQDFGGKLLHSAHWDTDW
jgi:cation diffusion facilitator CzcD-associated flavoprotein CzcO